MALHNHECARFRQFGMSCPFEELKEDDEEDEEHRIPIAIPARRSQSQMADNLVQFPIIAHGDPVMRKALERMAAIQHEGGLQSIPRSVPAMGLPSSGSVAQPLIAILTAVAIMEGLRRSRSLKSGASLKAVRASEVRAAKGLTQLSPTGRGSPRGQAAGGGGGFHMKAPTFRKPLTAPKLRSGDRQLRRLLGLPNRVAGFDEFSETGF